MLGAHDPSTYICISSLSLRSIRHSFSFFFFFGKNRIKNGIIEDFASLRSVSSSHCWSSPKAFRWQPFPLPPL
jgi:hypothetical protein